MAELRYDGRVAVITGAGGALGRAYALMFAKGGASVVVNDLGDRNTGRSKSADDTVEIIKGMGGKAVADYNNVLDGDKIVQTALDTFGRIDILVNNAGILRDVSFHKMTDDQWDIIMAVHVRGAYKCTRAAWPHMRQQKYGRILMTASSSGIYGNFGQSNYSAAKLGLVGFAHSLALEGNKYNIHTNSLAPVAGSEMTKTVMPPNMVASLKADYVAPVVGWLCHEECTENDAVIETAAGWIAKVRLQRSQGAYIPLVGDFTTGKVKEAWSAVNDFKGASNPKSGKEAFACIMKNLGTAKKSKL